MITSGNLNLEAALVAQYVDEVEHRNQAKHAGNRTMERVFKSHAHDTFQQLHTLRHNIYDN